MDGHYNFLAIFTKIHEYKMKILELRHQCYDVKKNELGMLFITNVYENNDNNHDELMNPKFLALININNIIVDIKNNQPIMTDSYIYYHHDSNHHFTVLVSSLNNKHFEITYSIENTNRKYEVVYIIERDNLIYILEKIENYCNMVPYDFRI